MMNRKDEELEELVQELGPDMRLTTSEYIDEDVATSATFENSANWRQELRDMVVSDGTCSKIPAIVEVEEEEQSDELPTDKITTYTKLSVVATIYYLFSQERGNSCYQTVCSR